MSGQRTFSEKCVCGAEIKLASVYEFIDIDSRNDKRYEQWQRQHANCIWLFSQIQITRLQKLLPDGEGE